MIRGALFAALVGCASALDVQSTAELYQVTPTRLNDIVNGTKTVFTAFVNPSLPHSAHFHRILHELKEMYAGRSDVVISFADLTTHRSFLKQYGIKEVPAVRVFARPLPIRIPIPLTYSSNKTATDFSRELDSILHTIDGYPKDAGYLAAQLKHYMGLIADWELGLARSHALEKKLITASKQKNEADVDAAGVATVAVDALKTRIAENAASTKNARGNATEMLQSIQAELEKQAKHYEDLARISRRRLEYLNRTLALAAGVLDATQVVSKEALEATQGAAGARSQIGSLASVDPGFLELEAKAKAEAAAAAEAAEDDDEDEDEDENARLIPGGQGSLARELNQKMRGFAMGNDFLHSLLKEEAMLSIGVLQELLRPFLQE